MIEVNKNLNISTPQSKFNSLENFKKISSSQKALTVFVTVLVTLTTVFIATVFVFKNIVWHYYKQNPDQQNDGTRSLTDSLGRSILIPPTPAEAKDLELSQYIQSLRTPLEQEQQQLLEDANKNQSEAIDRAQAQILKEEHDLNASLLEKTNDRILLGIEETQSNLVQYILDFMDDLKSDTENESQKIKDSDLLLFDKGKIAKTEDIDQAKASYKIFVHLLKETFGTELAEGVIGRYSLHNNEVITLLDLKKALVGIATNVRDIDLKNLFHSIRDSNTAHLSTYKAGNLLFPMDTELYNKIKSRVHFDELTPEEINFLHSAFRTVPISTAVTVAEVLKSLRPDAAEPQNALWKKDYIYWHDLEALFEMECWKDLDMKYPELALGEYTGKALGYVELRQGMVIPMPELNQGSTDVPPTPHFYKVHSSLPDKNDGVIAHILSPLNSKQTPIEKDAESDHAFMIFRGTNVDCGAKASGQSLYRDLHWAGIGRATYDAREADVQNLVEAYLVNAKDSVTLHLSGHSLGGCDTQRALVSLLEKVESAPEGSPWKKLKKIVLTTFNAPKPNPTVNKRFKNVIHSIDEKKIGIEVDLKHVRFFDNKREDWLQYQGDILVGADLDGSKGTPLKDASLLKRNLIVMKMLEEHGALEGFLTRHQYRPFNKKHSTMDNVNYEMTVLSSDNVDERRTMEKHMAGNFYWNGEKMNPLSLAANTAGWVAGDAVRNTGKGVVALFNAGHFLALQGTRWANGDHYDNDEKRRNAVTPR